MDVFIKCDDGDLEAFRGLASRIDQKEALIACLVVLQGIACSAGPPDGVRREGT